MGGSPSTLPPGARLPLLLAGALIAHAAGGADPAMLRTGEAIRHLSPLEAAAAPRVKLRGVLTFHDPAAGLAFLQDFSGGVALRANIQGVQVGDFVEATGSASMDDFAPGIRGTSLAPLKMRRLGTGEHPLPLTPAGVELLQPKNHGQWIEITGMPRALRREENRLIVEVASHGQLLDAILPGSWSEGAQPRYLLFRQARLRGVHAAVADTNRRLVGVRLYIPSLDYIDIELGEDLDVFAQPARRVDDLLRFVPEGRGRVRVQGIATLMLPGEGVFARGAGGSIFASLGTRDHSAATAAIAPGDRLDVAGTPVLRDGEVILEDAVCRVRGRGLGPEPVLIPAGTPGGSASDGELIAVEGELIKDLVRGGRQILVLRSGSQDFVAEQVVAGASTPAADLTPGSTLRLTGILRPEGAGARSVRLLMRTPEDVVVLRRPPFWTVRRALAALGAATLAAAAALFWNILLRRKVRAQTAVISEKIDDERIFQERSRIARELHDSLQQELAGIGLQLSTTDRLLLKDAAAAQAALGLARSMLRRSQEEARRSIWDLQPLDLTTGDLGAALQELFATPTGGDGPAMHVQVEGDLSAIPPAIEGHLLRVAQEAVTNALKHASADNISISLVARDGEIRLRVEDDGQGFEANNSVASARYKFGLSSMRERTNKIGATMQIESTPGLGTVLDVRVSNAATGMLLAATGRS